MPFLDNYGGELTYIKIPKEDLDKYLRIGAVAPGAEFKVSPEIAKTATIVEDRLRPNPVKKQSDTSPYTVSDVVDAPPGWGKV